MDLFADHRRIIARRGTEIFVVVDNEIRWSDLCLLKDDWEEAQEGNENERQPHENEKSKKDLGSENENSYKSSYRVGI